MTATELRRTAEEKLSDAGLLFRSGSWANAYYLAGYAIEIALKAIIAKRFSADEIPDRRFVNDIYTHDLMKLCALAELVHEREREEQAKPEFAANWAAVANWSEESRYSPADEKAAREMYVAVSHDADGVFQWLTRWW